MTLIFNKMTPQAPKRLAVVTSLRAGSDCVCGEDVAAMSDASVAATEAAAPADGGTSSPASASQAPMTGAPAVGQASCAVPA